jgi:hypothetical protein
MGLIDDLIRDIKQKALPSVEETVRDILGLDPKDEPTPPNTIDEVVADLRAKTRDNTDEEVVLRSLVIYRSIVNHVKTGGSVKFISPDGTLRTLKIRLR